MSRFGDIDNADATSSNGSRRPYFKAGNYIVQVNDVKFLETRNKGDAVIVEFIPLESNNEEVQPGIVHSWYCGLSSDLGPLNFKRFLAAAYGFDPHSEEANAKITSKVAEQAVSDSQPLRNAWVGLECSMTETQAGNPFTVHTYRPISQEEAGQVQQRLQAAHQAQG